MIFYTKRGQNSLNPPYELKKDWENGVTHVLLSPLELIEKLSALVPQPRMHLVRYSGVLAPNAKMRSVIIPGLTRAQIKEKEKQIRIMERPAVGVEYPEYQQALEDMKFDFGYALPEQTYAGGGIAGLSGGKRFGPPPLSGPMPQGGGLSSQFNRVKKLTG